MRWRGRRASTNVEDRRGRGPAMARPAGLGLGGLILVAAIDEVHRLRRQLPEAEGNAWAVRMELQADCLAGVWGHHAQRQRNLLEPGDLEEGLRAAAAIGDDRLQKQAQGYVVPESWTHGSSEQRVRWFSRGFASGEPADCETFR